MDVSEPWTISFSALEISAEPEQCSPGDGNRSLWPVSIEVVELVPGVPIDRELPLKWPPVATNYWLMVNND